MSRTLTIFLLRLGQKFSERDEPNRFVKERAALGAVVGDTTCVLGQIQKNLAIPEIRRIGVPSFVQIGVIDLRVGLWCPVSKESHELSIVLGIEERGPGCVA